MVRKAKMNLFISIVYQKTFKSVSALGGGDQTDCVALGIEYKLPITEIRDINHSQPATPG